MECYIAMARSKGGCSDLKKVVRKFFFSMLRGVLHYMHLQDVF